MSAKNYSGARYGLIADTTATGIVIANLTFDFTSEQAYVSNHIGTSIGVSIFNDTANVSLDGVLASRTAGLVASVADTVTLANSTANSLNVFTDGLFSTPVSNAGIILTGSTMARKNKEFETGSMTGIYLPAVDTSVNETLSD